MDAVELLRTPWADRLHELCGSVRRELRVCAPFVKRAAMCGALDALQTPARVRLVSSFSTARFHQGYSDTDAFRDVLQRNGQVRNHQHLHAKVYLFDEHAAVVTSANLTNAGLRRNWEYGVLLQDAAVVEGIGADFEGMWNAQEGSDIEAEVLDTIDEIVAKLPPARPVPRLPAPETDEPEVVLENATQAVAGSLTGWTQAVFAVLNEIEQETFSLQDDVYEFVPQLEELYPGNDNVEAKIRQQLQFLRNLGLVEFLGQGRYRKGWT